MIKVHRDGPVGVITLARPDKRNALTPEMLASLVSAVQQVAATDKRGSHSLGGGTDIDKEGAIVWDDRRGEPTDGDLFRL